MPSKYKQSRQQKVLTEKLFKDGKRPFITAPQTLDKDRKTMDTRKAPT